MKLSASKPLKWLYCLTLVAIIFPSGLKGANGWTALVTGGGLLPGGVILWLPIFVWRIFVVVRNPDALDAIVTGKFVKALRLFSIFLMLLGALASVAILFLRPIAIAIFSQPGDNGIAFFVTGVFLYLISGAGFLGVVLFEVIRLFGSKQQDAPVSSK
ncbi:hypothetical protein [Collimonas sp.]|jgi:hypothetical protein|uniref:hypothetical protein n=1 Tax=Collimonas sp. TaxID=1963772 RepID=UPI002C9D8944|nr:hypothetical protein [Collimonas sp.]HWW04228.1 hypothetical protein [Collimonas sp.]